MRKKIHAINDRIALTTAGAVGDLQFLVRIMRAEVALYEIREGQISVEPAATLLSNVLHSNRYFPYYAQLLMGGFDTEPKLFSIDPWGGMVSGEKFFVTGSGGPIALGLLESEYRDELDCKQGAKLALKAFELLGRGTRTQAVRGLTL